jgi:oligoribonuclease NrnB/cAMP/cGMP phosphodiesterase (DHH superfamily)
MRTDIKTLIYHKDCTDGFCAAYYFWKKYPDSIFIALPAGSLECPELETYEVVLADISFPRNVLIELSKTHKLTVLDHHKSAKEDCDGLEFCKFDMEKSGAGLMWDWLYPGEKRPWLVNYVEDRDLWKFKLPNSREVSHVLLSTLFTFESFECLEEIDQNELELIGIKLSQYKDIIIDFIVQQAEEFEYNGFRGMIVNSSAKQLTSEVAEILAARYGLAVVWYRSKNEMYFYSLRSTIQSGIDVANIAKTFPGGGGHKHAAGFNCKELIFIK